MPPSTLNLNRDDEKKTREFTEQARTMVETGQSRSSTDAATGDKA